MKSSFLVGLGLLAAGTVAGQNVQQSAPKGEAQKNMTNAIRSVDRLLEVDCTKDSSTNYKARVNRVIYPLQDDGIGDVSSNDITWQTIDIDPNKQTITYANGNYKKVSAHRYEGVMQNQVTKKTTDSDVKGPLAIIMKTSQEYCEMRMKDSGLYEAEGTFHQTNKDITKAENAALDSLTNAIQPSQFKKN